MLVHRETIKKASARTMTISGAVICFITAATLWGSKGLYGLSGRLLYAVALMGVLGLIPEALNRRNIRLLSPVVFGWMVGGGLIASFFIGISSAGTELFFAAFLYLAGTSLKSRWDMRSSFTNLGILIAGSLIFFTILFKAVQNDGFETVELPGNSSILDIYSDFDYSDAFRIQIPANQNTDIKYLTKLFFISMVPGISNAEWKSKIDTESFDPGIIFGTWEVFYSSQNEIIVGMYRNHIDFRLSILRSVENDNAWVTVSTVVRYNNLFGILYFIPVRYGHQILFGDAMRKMNFMLKEKR